MITNTEKATARPWHHYAAGERMQSKYSQSEAIASTDGKQLVAGCFKDVAGGSRQAFENAALIVQCVNEHDALTKLEESAKNALDELQLRGHSECGLGEALAALAAIRNK